MANLMKKYGLENLTQEQLADVLAQLDAIIAGSYTVKNGVGYATGSEPK